jgi:hypothetical protein
MALTASKLRENIYNILDEVLATGVPVEIERNGQTLRIVADAPKSKLDNLVARPDFVKGDPREIARIGFTADGQWYIKPESAILQPGDTNLNADGSRT